MCARLRDVAQRAAGRRRADERRRRAPVPRLARAGAARTSGAGRGSCSTSRTRSTDELAWLDAEGPTSPALDSRTWLAGRAGTTTCSSSARAITTPTTGRGVDPRRAILVPTAERDPAVAVSIFAPMFRGVRAIMYNSFEERAMIHALADNSDVPGVVVGVGSDVPAHNRPGARGAEVRDLRTVRHLRRPHRREQGLQGTVLVLRALRVWRGRDLSLVLVGTSILPDSEPPAHSDTSGSSTTRTSSTSWLGPRR